jgi:Zn-finger nucleic acid-binding protein
MTLYAERGYAFCTHCGAFHFPEPTSDGIRALGGARDDLRCPLCHQPLLVATLEERYPAHYCQACRGLLLERASFRGVIQLRRASAAGPGVAPRPLARAELARQVSCPACGQIMDTHPYLGPGNVVIDTCSTCDLIWLDHGELRAMVDAPGSDRGVPLAEQQAGDTVSEDGDEVIRVRDGRVEIDIPRLLGRLFG